MPPQTGNFFVYPGPRDHNGLLLSLIHILLLRHRVIEKQRQIEHGADGGIARIVDHAAVMRRLLHVRRRIAAPCGGNISKGSFHLQHLRYL